MVGGEQVGQSRRRENLRRRVCVIWMENRQLSREGKLPVKRLELSVKLETAHVYDYSRSLHTGIIYNDCFINRNSWWTLNPQIYTVFIKIVGGEQVGRSRRREDLRRRVRGIWMKSWENHQKLETTHVYVYSRSHHTETIYNGFINHNRWKLGREQGSPSRICEDLRLRRRVCGIWMENHQLSREGKLPDERLELTVNLETTQVYVYSRSLHTGTIYNGFINRNRWRLKP
jgi:hypothetical protein